MLVDSISSLNAQAAAAPMQGEVFCQVAQVNIKTTKTNKPYLEVTLADVSGSMTIKIWDNAHCYPAFSALAVNASVAVTGNWQVGQYGIEGADLDVRPLTPEEEEILLSGGEELCRIQREAWEYILQTISSVAEPRLRALCDKLVSQFETRFRRAGAARKNHHARRGGLVEHTSAVMRNAAAICTAYPNLNRDLLLAGALFHDCGKMWENPYEEHSLVMPYTDMGEMLGHITVGIEIINKLWADLMADEQLKADWKPLQPASDQVRLHLMHLVASHHGILEYGSPVVPKTPEALALNHADDLDAKMEMFRVAYAEAPELAPHIRQRVFPLPSNVVKPLPSWEHEV